MKSVLTITLKYGAETEHLERADELAEIVNAGEYVICFPEKRGTPVERVAHDLHERRTYCVLAGVVYDAAWQFTDDRRHLLDSGWRVRDA